MFRLLHRWISVDSARRTGTRSHGLAVPALAASVVAAVLDVLAVEMSRLDHAVDHYVADCVVVAGYLDEALDLLERS
jgi:hypothetical protein